MRHSSIVLGGGCFWCLEAAYQQVAGVISAIPGYSGGTRNDARYEAVSTGTTSHAEVVRVIFDPSMVSLEQLMAVFWLIHDPTSKNRQGADIGPQYASVVYFDSDAQLSAVTASRDKAQAYLDESIVTRIEPLDEFYEAEEYHRNYFQRHPEAGYCQVVIEPKLQKLKTHFSSLLKR